MATTDRKRFPRRTVALERALSKLGIATRSEARTLIESGRVWVDGRVVRSPLHAVVPERAAIAIDGRVRRPPAPLTIVLHKPRGVVTTRSDPEGRATVYDSLSDLDAHLVPVGRLDVATSGLLILTNDTRLADWLTDPDNGVQRVYLVTVRGRVDPEKAARLTQGIHSRGETLSARRVEIRKASGRETHLVMTLDEGKNREIRRLCEAIGNPVTELRRVQFGGLSLGTLPPGRWRALTDRELDEAFPGRPRKKPGYNRRLLWQIEER